VNSSKENEGTTAGENGGGGLKSQRLTNAKFLFQSGLLVDILILFFLATKSPEEVHDKVGSGCGLD
jgi:hypothetical protein